MFTFQLNGSYFDTSPCLVSISTILPNPVFYTQAISPINKPDYIYMSIYIFIFFESITGAIFRIKEILV